MLECRKEGHYYPLVHGYIFPAIGVLTFTNAGKLLLTKLTIINKVSLSYCFSYHKQQQKGGKLAESEHLSFRSLVNKQCN